MVQLIAAIAIGGVAYVAYSSLKKHLSALEEAEREEALKTAKAAELEQDPKTGVYRPKK